MLLSPIYESPIFCVGCVQALTSVIERSTATTMMGLEKELKDAASSLERHVSSTLAGTLESLFTEPIQSDDVTCAWRSWNVDGGFALPASELKEGTLQV